VETGGEAPNDAVLLVDGVRANALTARSMRVAVPAGTHYLSVQSTGGVLASAEQRITDGIPASVFFPLWPVAHIHGRVRIANATTLFGTQPPLAGIAVTLQPANVSVQTDQDGNFAFPAQALDPASTIAVEGESLPAGLAAPAETRLHGASEPLEIILTSSKTIERVRF
jgi:hypothetical protein